MRDTRIRIGRWALIGVALTVAMLTGGVQESAAATLCVKYDAAGRTADGSVQSSHVTFRNVTVCSAPVADFPRSSSWGRVYGFSSGCGYMDPNDWHPCDPMYEVPEAWRWKNGAWSAVLSSEIDRNQAFYFVPFAAGWRWAWNSTSGWIAIPERFATFRWYG